ncbi:MAG: virulence RhuM family protein [Spirochaetes bacterium]|nr:virulence RhuM family protein [Spirochaetota bacterium]
MQGIYNDTISEHLQTLYEDKELDESQVCRKFRQTSDNGNYTYKFYNLEAIIAVGFKVNSERAIQFRQWAAKVLKDFAIRGYVLDKKRLGNGIFLSDDYFKHLIEEIREISLSERMFYQKVTDIYVTAIDYDSDSYKTKLFYKTVQNKLHYAIHRHTAAEKEHMGLTTWEKAPHGKILKSDVSIAKNYLSDRELKSLSRTVGMYLDYAEQQAERHIPMTMDDWTKRLDSFLKFNEYGVLNYAGSVSADKSPSKKNNKK